jgi:hypothetical protein
MCVSNDNAAREKEKVLIAKTFAGEKSGFRSALSAARAEKINRREIVEYITEWPLM